MKKKQRMKARVGRILFLLFPLSLCAQFAAGQQTADSKANSHKTVWNHSNGMSSFNVEIRGKIELTDDDRDIKSMSSDGYLEINKTAFASKRTLIVTPQGSALKREDSEGRTSVPFELEVRKWMNDTSPELA